MLVGAPCEQLGRGLHHRSRDWATNSQYPTWNIIVHMTKIYFYKRERDIIYWGWIHFVDWSVIKLSEFHIWRSALWPLCSRVIYQEMVYALMTTPSNSPALGWGLDVITLLLQLAKQHIRSCMYVISLVFSFVICFIILVVSMSGAAWLGARRLLPPPRVACAHCARTHAHTYTRIPKQITARYIWSKT